VTPLVRTLALRIGAVDWPGGRRIHTVPLPKLGGVSIVLSVCLAILISAGLKQTGRIVHLDYEFLAPLLLGGAIVFLMGVWDDLRPLQAWVKFLFQAVAAAAAIGFGIRVESMSFLGGGPADLGLLAVPITFLWIVGITNAFNLVDGLDGLATGLAIIAAGTSATIFFLRGDVSNALLLVIVLGALAGFLRYNFNPATIFLGDSGSLVVGYTLALTAVAGSQKTVLTLSVIIPLLVFGLPILDTLLSMVRRFAGGLKLIQPHNASFKERIRCVKHMFEADKGHIHHRLLAKGLSHRNAVLILYLLALGLSFLALTSVLAQYRNAGIILVVVGLATFIGIRKLGYEEVSVFKAEGLLHWYEQLPFNRYFFLAFVDIALIAFAYWGAFVLKYELIPTRALMEWHLSTFPMVLFIQLGVFWGFGIYRGLWRAMGIGDLIRLTGAVGTAAALSYSVALIREPPTGTNLAFFCINLLLLATLIVGARSSHRILNYIRQDEEANGGQALIYGAGRGGRRVLRELRSLSPPLRPIGFVDDEPTLKGRTVDRVRVLGSGNDIASLLEHQPVTVLIISSHKINSHRLQKVISLCREKQIEVFRCNLQLEALGAERFPLSDERLGHRVTWQH